VPVLARQLAGSSRRGAPAQGSTVADQIKIAADSCTSGPKPPRPIRRVTMSQVGGNVDWLKHGSSLGIPGPVRITGWGDGSRVRTSTSREQDPSNAWSWPLAQWPSAKRTSC